MRSVAAAHNKSPDSLVLIPPLAPLRGRENSLHRFRGPAAEPSKGGSTEACAQVAADGAIGGNSFFPENGPNGLKKFR